MPVLVLSETRCLHTEPCSFNRLSNAAADFTSVTLLAMFEGISGLSKSSVDLAAMYNVGIRHAVRDSQLPLTRQLRLCKILHITHQSHMQPFLAWHLLGCHSIDLSACTALGYLHDSITTGPASPIGACWPVRLKCKEGSHLHQEVAFGLEGSAVCHSQHLHVQAARILRLKMVKGH